MIKIIGVGKIKEKAMNACIEEYVKRCKAFTKLEIIEVSDESIPQNNSEKQNEQAKKIEGERILSKIKDNEYVIVLDLWGETCSSEKFAKKLEEIQTYHSSNITFVIGGSLGLSPQLVQRANFRFKLSDCTFPHQLCRLLLVEQIYRSFMISNNMPYHK